MGLVGKRAQKEPSGKAADPRETRLAQLKQQAGIKAIQEFWHGDVASGKFIAPVKPPKAPKEKRAKRRAQRAARRRNR